MTKEMMVENRNFLSDKFYMSGSNYSGAVSAFHSIETATKSVEADLSLISVLSVIGKKGGIRQTVLLDGNDELEVRDGNVCLKDASFINVKCKDAEAEDDFDLFFQMGGVYKTPVSISNPDLLAVSGLVFKPLSKHLKIEHKPDRGFFRDADVALKCASLEKEDVVHFLYREKDGVKKAFSCFVNSDGLGFLKFDVLWNIVRKASRRTVISEWEITQTQRSITFLTQYRQKLKVTWSDTGFVGVTAEINGEVTRIRNLDDLKDFIERKLGEDARREALFTIPVAQLLEQEAQMSVDGWNESQTQSILEACITNSNTVWDKTILTYPHSHMTEIRTGKNEFNIRKSMKPTATYSGKMVTVMLPGVNNIAV